MAMRVIMKLIEMSGKPTMEFKGKKTITSWITVNNILRKYPDFMKNIFTTKQNTRVQPYDLAVRKHNTATYSRKSLRIFGPKIWNKLRIFDQWNETLGFSSSPNGFKSF